MKRTEEVQKEIKKEKEIGGLLHFIVLFPLPVIFLRKLNEQS